MRMLVGAALGAVIIVTIVPVPVQAQTSTPNNGVLVSASAGWSFLRLPKTEFALNQTDVSAPGVKDITTGKLEDHDGRVSGGQFDASLHAPAWPGLLAGITGFYSDLSGDHSAFCDGGPGPAGGSGNNGEGTGLGSEPDCGWSNLYDPDNRDNKGETRDLLSTTKRKVRHWGAAVEVISGFAPVGQNSASVGLQPLQWKVGLAVKAIDQKTSLTLVEISGNRDESANLSEDLNTRYWGGYGGLKTSIVFGGGFSISADGEIGVYHARTTFDGAFASFGEAAQQTYMQTLSLEKSKVAAIGKLKISLDQRVGSSIVSLYGAGKFYSYAPRMAYNDVDRASDTDPGFNDGSRIDNGRAWSFSAGARLTIPLGGP